MEEDEKKGYALSQIVRIQYSVFKCSTTCVLNVVFLVLLCNKHIGSSWDELMGLQLSASFIIHRKVHLQTTLLNVVLPAHTQGGKSQHKILGTCVLYSCTHCDYNELSFNYTLTQTSLTTQLLLTSCSQQLHSPSCLHAPKDTTFIYHIPPSITHSSFQPPTSSSSLQSCCLPYGHISCTLSSPLFHLLLFLSANSLYPYEGVVVFRVNGLQVLNGQLLV